MAITSFCLAVFCLLSIGVEASEDFADEDVILGSIVFAVASLAFGTTNILQKRWGKGLSIAGIVLAVLAILAGIGYFVS